MDTESSSRSPDSSCPDYFPYDVANTNRDRSSNGVNIQMNSNIGTTNGQITADLSKNQSYQNKGKTIIQLALRKNGDRLNSTVQSSSRGQSYHNNDEGVSSFPSVESQWNGSSSATNNLGGYLSSLNYQNSSTSSRRIGIDTFYTPTIGQVHTSHNPPSCSKPELPYYASSSTLMVSAKTTAQPKLEHPNAPSSSSDLNYLSIPTSNTAYENCTRQQRNYAISDPVALKRTETTIFPNTNHSRHDSLHSISHVPQLRASSYNSNPQLPEISAKPSCMGLKRKAPAIRNSDYLSSAPSSSNYAGKEQNISNESKKNKPNSNLSYLENDDDEIQIIIPNTTSHSSTSLSIANHQRRSVISNHGSLSASNFSEPATTEHNHNRLLDNQSSSQTTHEGFSSIHDPLSSVALEQMLDSVWTDLDDIASSANVTSTADSTAAIQSDESSDEVSIISVHEAVKESNSLQNSKPGSPILEAAPSDLPALITLDSSPKNEELQELKANEEAENVKEGFKKLIEDELICNICTEVLIKPITLGCSHTFCKFCISEWKEKKRQCPMCRASIETETPCLFLDNFISKAVEQLDPASVEKRLEIIKSREEEQKKKTHKSSAQQSQSSNMAEGLNPRQVIRLLSSSIRNERRAIMIAQVQQRRQQYLNMPRQSSNVPQASLNIPQISSNITQPSANVSERSGLPLSMFQSPSDLTQPFSHQFYQPNLFPYGPPNGYFY